MNVLFTCGGTAGHVNPAVALAHIFQERHPGCRILFVGADGGMENKLVPKEGYQIQTVTITNFRRSFAPFLPFLERCEAAGYAARAEGCWRLTPRGFLVSNQIIGELLAQIEEE